MSLGYVKNLYNMIVLYTIFPYLSVGFYVLLVLWQWAMREASMNGTSEYKDTCALIFI